MAVFLSNTYDQITIGEPGADQQSLPSPPLSPLSCGTVEETQISHYDNVRSQSQLPHTKVHRTSLSSTLGDGSTQFQMLPSISRNTNAVRSTNVKIEPDDGVGLAKVTKGESSRSTTNRFAKLKYYYEQSPIRHIGPFLLLAIYAVAGAFLFYWIEHDYETQLLQKETFLLSRLRNETYDRLRTAIATGRHFEAWAILNGHEERSIRIRVPEGTLAWDMWGALLYVGTVFTTIGYGNITPRTTAGRAMSIVYAIIGIPLVLAILNHCSKKMTRFASKLWIKHRENAKIRRLREIRRTKLLRKQKSNHLADSDVDIEGAGAKKSTVAGRTTDTGIESNGETVESRTIPVWLAASVCIGYMCSIAALFCIWEKRWNYFTSFYFICISCLTIGLGDIIPDHPHMLILMFVFVIFGLSIVSMLISVIQIKMEEWLYQMMLKMQKEYQRALETGDAVEREKIMNEVMKNEPWFMRNLASMCITENQEAKLDEKAETLEKVLRTTNTKTVQTDVSIERVRTAEMGTDPCILPPSSPDSSDSSLAMVTAIDESMTKPLIKENLLKTAQDIDSISDVTSLPIDPACNKRLPPVDYAVQTEMAPLHDKSLQTEAGRFHAECATQCDEHPTTEMGTKTDSLEHKSTGIQVDHHPKLADKTTETECKFLQDQSVDVADHCQLISRSMETMNSSIGRGECSRSVQTMFPEDGGEELLSPAADKRRRFSNSKQQREFEMEFSEQGVQCLLQDDTCDMGVQTDMSGTEIENALTALEYPSLPLHLLPNDEIDRRGSCSDSIIVYSGQEDEEEEIPPAKPEVTKQDLIIQTDDSYLRIARRLDAYRTNKTPALQVYAAPSHSTRQGKGGVRSPKVLITGASEDATTAGLRANDGMRELSGSRTSVRWQDEEDGDKEEESSSRRSSMAEEEFKKGDKSKKRTSFLEPTSPTGGTHRSMAQRIRQSLRRKKKKKPSPPGDGIQFTFEGEGFSDSAPPISPILKKGRKPKPPPVELPERVQAGKVSDYVKKHEKGNHSPGVDERSTMVTVIDMRPEAGERS